jgi:RNA polymerase sigma-70 factor (ECF subfamily)
MPQGDDRHSDSALMELLVRKESAAADALAKLYDRYSRAIFSLAVRITQQGATAEEVVQDVFLQLWRNAHRYHTERGALGPWLFTMARNRALDHLRKKHEKQRRREDAMEEFDAAPIADVAHHSSPETQLDRQRRAEQVRAHMAGLPEKQRRSIELAYFEGMTHSEIAAALNEPLGTVKSWIRTGLLRLREVLEAAT